MDDISAPIEDPDSFGGLKPEAIQVVGKFPNHRSARRLSKLVSMGLGIANLPHHLVCADPVSMYRNMRQHLDVDRWLNAWLTLGESATATMGFNRLMRGWTDKVCDVVDVDAPLIEWRVQSIDQPELSVLLFSEIVLEAAQCLLLVEFRDQTLVMVPDFVIRSAVEFGRIPSVAR